jgi:hypothetical protein
MAVGGTPTNQITFAAAATTSSILTLPGTEMQLVGLVFPSSWTAETLTIQGSVDGQNFYNIFSASQATPGALSYSAFAASQILALRRDDFNSVAYVQLTSGAAQTNAVTITAVFRTFS